LRRFNSFVYAMISFCWSIISRLILLI
jgi:hypothetical protein